MVLTDDTRHNETEDTSKALVVKDFPVNVFHDDNIKRDFEYLFLPFGDVKFIYLPGFKRIIVNYTKAGSALLAMEKVNGMEFCGCSMKLYFKEEAKKLGEDFLKLPQAERLFLISPPASPPVGWTPKEEPIPVVNYDLITAIAGLEMPDKSVELLSKTDSTPAIFVNGCENPENNSNKNLKNINSLPRHEVQTQRPPIQ